MTAEPATSTAAENHLAASPSRVQTGFLELISGARRGPLAAGVRGLLAASSVVYRVAQRLHFAGYDLGIRGVHSAGIPVVSVGNLTVGGTGKTPLVELLARRLSEAGLTVAILSRGYGAAAEGADNDEVAVLRENLGDRVLQVVDADRVAGAARARSQGAEVAILDDGFQHRRLARDVDLVVIDATRPFGFGRLLPRGLLREPLSGLTRASGVVISRADQVSEDARDAILKTLEARGFGGPVSMLGMLPRAVYRVGPLGRLGAPESAQQALAGRSVAALSAVGNPHAFVQMLDGLGARVVHGETFRDHHRYRGEDLQSAARRAEAAGAELIVTTQKDGVKLRGLLRDGLPAVAPALVELWIEASWQAGQGAIETLINDCVGGKLAPRDTLAGQPPGGGAVEAEPTDADRSG